MGSFGGTYGKFIRYYYKKLQKLALRISQIGIEGLDIDTQVTSSDL